MLDVLELEQALNLIKNCFQELSTKDEMVNVINSKNRILQQDIVAEQEYPVFNRSCVDGYAVMSSDVLGCSDSLPSILNVVGSVEMGKETQLRLSRGECVYVPTGGQIPECADTMIMIEYTEDYHDGTIGILHSAAPGANIIFAGDDAKLGEILIPKGTVIGIKEIGILSALGISKVKVKRNIKVGVLSSGDEIILSNQRLQPGQIYDANGPMICAALEANNCEVEFLGIVRDDYNTLNKIICSEISKYDMLIISGGTSVGEKDITTKIIQELGEVLLHGLAVKPGKPTVVGKINNKAFWGLPGNPVATYFILHTVLIRFIHDIQGVVHEDMTIEAELQSNVSSNNGREEFVSVQVKEDKAIPIIGKSGLIIHLSKANGYIKIERNTEGLPKGSKVLVYKFW